MIPLVNQELFTKESMQARNPRLQKIYSGKHGSTKFVATGSRNQEIVTVSSIFNKEKKETDASTTPQQWIGKVGLPSGSLRNNQVAIVSRTEQQINRDSIREKIALDLYGELGKDRFEVPNTRLSMQPIDDGFITNDDLAEEWIAQGIESCLRVVSRKIKGFTPFAQAKTLDAAGKAITLMDYIRQNHCPPETIQTPVGTSVPLRGLIELLAAGRVLADPNIIGVNGEYAGFKWVCDQTGSIIAAQVVKVDAGSALQFNDAGVFMQHLAQPKDLQIAEEPGCEVEWIQFSQSIQYHQSSD